VLTGDVSETREAGGFGGPGRSGPGRAGTLPKQPEQVPQNAGIAFSGGTATHRARHFGRPL